MEKEIEVRIKGGTFKLTVKPYEDKAVDDEVTEDAVVVIVSIFNDGGDKLVEFKRWIGLGELKEGLLFSYFEPGFEPGFSTFYVLGFKGYVIPPDALRLAAFFKSL